MACELEQLLIAADALLEPEAFQDYCPNGLQVEGRRRVEHLVSGVTASRAFIEAAIEAGADALLVHHGFFWKGEDARVVGMKRERLALLLANDISLLAYHLPLDAHPLLGNNAQLARRLGIEVTGPLEPGNPRPVGNVGELPEPLAAELLRRKISETLGREALLVEGNPRPVRRIGWCTGGAQGYLMRAAAQGVDAYISGEISEQTVHEARELGIHYIAAGHHATERYGAPAVAAHLADHFGIRHTAIEIDNPA